jgi:hypothetical protein
VAISRREARELMSRGYELGATVLLGALRRQDDGTWRVGDRSLEDMLADLEGQEVAVVAAPVGQASGTTEICRVCGTEYQGHSCPRCREIRSRLRGST